MSVSESVRKAIFEDMLRSRIFDEVCQAAIDRDEPLPHFHAGIGQEALTVAPVHALEEDDNLLYSHRGYGQLFARGVPIEKIVADMLYKETGTNRGFGGVLHVADPDRGIPGRNGVFGTRFTVASGLGLSKQLQGTDEAVLCFYGEAAGARGPLFEAMNFMSLWGLPVVLIAENNGYSISSRTEDIYAPGDMSTFAEGFDIPREVVDGNDADAVYEAVSPALDRARNGGGPTVIEGKTYRIAEHIPSDKGEYRSGEEIERWRKRDPVDRLGERLIESGTMTEEAIERKQEQLRDQVTETIREVRGDSEPSADQAFDYVYYGGDR